MKVAVITGAASGIGLALSHVCLQKGIHVVMVDKDAPKLAQEAQLLHEQFPEKVTHLACNVTQEKEVQLLAQQVYTQFGHIDWLFNNAGIMGKLAPVWTLSAEEIHTVMDVNLYGMLHMIRAFIPRLIADKHPAHIINIASMYALSSGSQLAAYSMSKHAVLAMSESLHFDLMRSELPITVSVVFPSFTDTALLSNQSATQDAFANRLNTLLAHARPPQEVAEYIVQQAEQKQFYILPDKEVKGYCEGRTQAIVMQETPYISSIEKLIGSLIKRTRS